MTYQLPTLAQLHEVTYEQISKDDRVLAFLNQEPPAQWIKYHPTVKTKNEQNQSVPLAYLPIDKVELLMTTIFRRWRAEIVKVEPMFNSIVIHARVHYLWPGTENDWRFVDGVGAQGIQTDAGALAADLSKIKFAAVQIAAPAAFSFAKKDACENLGRVFGRDLNKYGVIAFEPFAPVETAEKPKKEKPAPKVIQDQPEINTAPSFDFGTVPVQQPGNTLGPDQQWDPKSIAKAQEVIKGLKSSPDNGQPNFSPIQF